jgi:hypothetical protein
MKASILLYLVAFMRLFKEKSVNGSNQYVDQDSYQTLTLCLNILTTDNQTAKNIILNESRRSFVQYLNQIQSQQKKHQTEDKQIQEKVEHNQTPQPPSHHSH